ncbi:MoxR family ATPase [Pseudonocardia eucalypti]|uniref:MoxR family ATPase n=1 Tax=Pseudonocardia eucalypti TaxID=648755 RepID=A0ABP9Q2Y3_9PSEU|nr:MoxR-like ATPase [Pseudonocardia eucalypti]
MTELATRRGELAGLVVGRERELDLILAAVVAGRDLLLEGPPGTSKSTILRAITGCWGVPLHFVEGNAELTPAKLVGHHNPARVLREDYSADNFVPGPLVAAMREGGFLYVEEFNRAPEDTLNTLLTAMAEREVNVPRVGRIHASDSFRLVASMNPFDAIGTTRISQAVYDRMCRLAVGYQSVEEDRSIVTLRTSCENERLVADAVAITRSTREHPDVRHGSSVRGAIDLVAVAAPLTEIRAGRNGLSPEDAYRAVVLDAALLSLSGRITVDEAVEATPEQVIRELWEQHFVLAPRRAAPGAHTIQVPEPT